MNRQVCLFIRMAHNFISTHFTAAVLREQAAYYGRAQPIPPAPGPDELGGDEEDFIGRRDSFYMATVNADGWPYLQHRGGPRGFLKVLDPHSVAFADLAGNRQLLSTGNVAGNDRVALFLMDYPRRERLKLMGHAETVAAAADPALAARLAPEGMPARMVERIFRIRVTGFDWNCPKYITPRFTADEIEQVAAPLKRRIAELEAALRAASGRGAA
jgi:predicted pyridoxine 5'-phosphate oxidase superfamily flavin-nucleotide-binding protein